ncbi:MAG: hypothetical protein VX438_08120, partial [Planctomycetota bacterium]|nr:hypothetical protein [Planctomycetota bacterium]
MSYFVRRADRVSGPFTKDQVQAGIESGKLLDTDQISTTQEGPWQTVGQTNPSVAELPTAGVVTPGLGEIAVGQDALGSSSPVAQSGYSMPCRLKFIGTGGGLFSELVISFLLLFIKFGLYGPWVGFSFKN